MKQVFIEQGTPEWLELRRTKIGASVSPALLGKNPYMSAKNVYDQIVLGTVAYVNDAMRHGTEEEPIARDYYNRLGLTAFMPAVCVNDNYPYMMASLDGYDDDSNEILEIKCPGDKMFNDCMDGKIPEYWKYQIQHQLLISEAEFATLLIWKNENEYKSFTFYPIPKMMEEVRGACSMFYAEHLLEFKPPEDKYEERADSEWFRASNRWKMAKSNLKAAELAEKEANQVLISLANGKAAKGAGVRVERNEIRGLIDYNLVEEIKGIDMDQYRKPSTIRWRICETDVK